MQYSSEWSRSCERRATRLILVVASDMCVNVWVQQILIHVDVETVVAQTTHYRPIGRQGSDDSSAVIMATCGQVYASPSDPPRGSTDSRSWRVRVRHTAMHSCSIPTGLSTVWRECMRVGDTTPSTLSTPGRDGYTIPITPILNARVSHGQKPVMAGWPRIEIRDRGDGALHAHKQLQACRERRN